jgi:23S rRNA (uracil1939-C5)-methyltransferase
MGKYLSENKKSFDAIVVDPPRAGLDKTLTSKILELEIPTVIYISCNPVTLARDVSMLESKYERASTLYPFDFFPRSAHVESLIVLRLKPASVQA